MDFSEKKDVIEKMLAVQEREGWLPKKELERIAKEARVPLARVYGIATFYEFFSLKPRKEKEKGKCLDYNCRLTASEIVEKS